MPLPLIIGGAVVAIGALGLARAGLSARDMRGKSILIVGPATSGKSSLASIFGDHDVVIKPSRTKRWRNQVARLVDLQLKTTTLDTPSGEDGLEAIRTRARAADLICVVVSASALVEASNTEGALRIAKLVGELAGKQTRCAIVVSHSDRLEPDRLAHVLRSPSLLRMQDLTGAAVVRPCDLTDRATWNDTAAAVLSALGKRKQNRRESR